MATISKTISLRSIAAAFFIAHLGLFSQSALGQSQEPMITFDQSHPLVEQTNPIPMVLVFADGTAIINRKAGHKNPGQYTIKLTAEELSELKSLAEHTGISNFDEAIAGEVPESSDTLTYISDPTTTTIVINRAADNTAVSGTADVAITQTLEVQDVAATADANPGSPTMQTMKRLHIKMIELFSNAGA